MIGSGIGITQVACRGGAAAFSPLSLFSSGEEGAWYDPSDLSTLFQDAAGTVPVTADSQPVRLMLDKSGNGNHATAPSDAARPLYKTAGGLHWLEFDGVDDILNVTGATLTADMDLVAGAYRDGNSMMLHSAGSSFLGVTQAGSAALASGDAGSPAPSYAVNQAVLGVSTTRAQLAAAWPLSTPVVARAEAANLTSVGWGSAFKIGFYASFAGIKRWYSFILRESLTAEETADAEAYVAAKSGVTLP